MDANKQLIETLISSEVFQNYGRAFNGATALALTLHSVVTWQLPFHGKPHENPFCAIMAESESLSAGYLRFQEKLMSDAASEPASRTCDYGLCEIAVPVKCGPQTIGFLHTGQVMTQNPTQASFLRAVTLAAKSGVNFNNSRTKKAYFSTRVLSLKKLNALSGLLAIFAEHLSLKSNQISVQTANAESSVMTKTKQFIREHCREELSLGQVSNAMNMSLFHFCKTFRKGAGVCFTEFVSRTRIEMAKNLLCNPHLRISEVAYDSGFQSLTHFNRVFKKIEGRCPTDYRDKFARAA